MYEKKVNEFKFEGKLQSKESQTFGGREVVKIKLVQQSEYQGKITIRELEVACWNDVKTAANNLSIGQEIVVSGTIGSRNYEKEGGKKITYYSFNANNIQVKPENTTESVTSSYTPNTDLEGIPF